MGFEGLLLIGGISAGILQVLGYVLYVRDEHIEPNPVAWLMFAYGTAILTILEADRNAMLSDLILPAVCAVMGMYVAYRCWKRARMLQPEKWWPRDWWPEDREDRAAFIVDILITAGYISVWFFLYFELVSTEARNTAALVFLLGSNMSTWVAFIPLLRAAHKEPHKERALPWVVWTAAYTILIGVTFAGHGLSSELMIYPVSCALLHGLVAFLVRGTRRTRVSTSSLVSHVPS